MSEGVEVDAAAAAEQLVAEGEDDEHGQLGLQDLGQQPEGALQLGRVEQDDEPVRGRGPLRVVLRIDDLGDDDLVGTDRVEAVGAGQVLDDDPLRTDDRVALEPGHRHARVVAGLGAQAGQGVEQGRLPGVGAADEGEAAQAGCGGEGFGWVATHAGTTRIPFARERRSATSVPQTR